MEALDPAGIPGKWSLKPEDTLGLIFWTKNPSSLLTNLDLFDDFRVKVHVTVTGWTEVEQGAPNMTLGTDLLCLSARYLGVDNVTWRFSPVPLVPDAVERFEFILENAAKAGIRQVFVSFLQENDRLPETRPSTERVRLLQRMGAMAHERQVMVRLCNDDFSLLEGIEATPGLSLGVCAPPEDFSFEDQVLPPIEKCGCVKAVDPFSLNEACAYSCEYCYTSDRQIADRKRNTTARLPILP
jgi:DNA repair photolyase